MMSSAIQSEATRSQARSPGSATRIEELDWVKGALIIFMVIYHAVNYSKYRLLAFEYLAFLPPSFILITGFIVGQIYAAKYDLNTWKPYLRLAVRGAKLLVLFAVLNLANCMLREKSLYYGFWDFADRSASIFISGNGRVAIFEVLLPIAYFLLLAPALLWVRGRVGAIVPLCAVVLFALCWILESRDTTSDNLVLLSAGLLGMALGLIPLGFINRLASQWILPLLIYVCYRLGDHFEGELYWVQMLGSVATVLLLYTVAVHFNGSACWTKTVIKMGNYSLFSYLAQIALLQAIVRILGGQPERWLLVAAMVAITTILLLGLVFAIDFLRKRSRLVNESYKVVFA